MQKNRKKADPNTMQSLPLVWDDKTEENRKSTIDLHTVMHDETAEDAVNALLHEEEDAENTSSAQKSTSGGQRPLPPPEPPQDEANQEPESQEEEPEEVVSEILEPANDESLGNALTKLRGGLGCSLQELADKSKIPLQKIKALEEGNYDEISNINMGSDYVRKLCIEYVVDPDLYVKKFQEEFNRYHKEETSSRTVSAPSTGGLPAIDMKPKRFISIPSLLIGALIIALCLFIIGGLGKLYFKKSVAKSPTRLSEMTPVNRGAIPVFPVPEEQ